LTMRAAETAPMPVLHVHGLVFETSIYYCQQEIMEDEREKLSRGSSKDIESSHSIQGDDEIPLREEDMYEKPILLLFLVAHSVFGLYFGYDTLSALTVPLKAQFGFTPADMGSLLSAYPLATLILVFFGGALYELFGARKMLIGTTFINTLGIFIIANSDSFYPMYVGQLLFGSGSCYLYFVVITLIGGWFKGAKRNFKLNVAIGCLHCWLRIGSFSSYNTLPRINDKFGLRWALYTAFFVCLTSFVSAILFVFSDVLVEKRRNRMAPISPVLTHQETDSKVRPIQERGFFAAVGRALKFYWDCYSSFPFAYWMLAFIATGFVSSLFTFTSFGIQLLTKGRGIADEDASFMVSMLPIANGLSTALVSTAIGFIGFRTYFAILAGSLTVAAYVIFWLTNFPPIAIYIGLGLVQSLMDAIIFPCIAIVVPKEVLSYSTSLTIFLYNVALYGMNQGVGRLADVGYYNIMMGLFVGMGVLCALPPVALRFGRFSSSLDKR